MFESIKRMQLSHAMHARLFPATPLAKHADRPALASSAAASATGSDSVVHPTDQAAASDTRGGGPSSDRDASKDVAKPRRRGPPSSGVPAAGSPQPALSASPKRLRKPSLSSWSDGGGYLAFSFDLETTGLLVTSARILDIAVVDVQTGRWGS